MSDTPSTPETPAAPETPAETFSRDYVEGLRTEAAKYRNEKKDAVETAKTEARSEVVKEYEPQLAERDTTIAGLTSDLSAREVELAKLKAVLGAEIPTEDVLTVAELVQGTDEESISASVQRVKSIYGKTPGKGPAFDPSQGHGGHIPLNGDPVLEMFRKALGDN
ncbi:head scaffolding protein [Mycobacterium phage MyraDee]|uniref:Scaffolding protein n=1 Tax=Mycobacterium phage MyraDee TaxID=2024303 RepID=A0A222YZ91_9CAUD|nr:head scaffolding protein [Mycobacterium phage MyraDee]ASR77120.1 scaffolding protein [Mycobacterium phage MyraDee]